MTGSNSKNNNAIGGRADLWLASYPRSGNTYLRTILNHCFGLKSASICGGDLGRNAALESYVGHYDHSLPGVIAAPPGQKLIVKTHAPPPDDGPAIYVIRDGRAATASLWQFLGQSVSMRAVIAGDTDFGTWSDHLQAWDPRNRPDTLFLRYEDFADKPAATIRRIGEFIDAPVISFNIPSRDKIAAADGRWVRKQSRWQEVMRPGDLVMFDRVNAEAMRDYGYYQ